MKITAVDDQRNLFLVEEALPQDLLESIKKEEFHNYPWAAQEMQLNFSRRQLLVDDTGVLADVAAAYNDCLTDIEHHLNIAFHEPRCWSSFWLDYAGFRCPVHLDGEERGYRPRLAMQLYLSEDPDAKLGTVFYHDAQGKHTRYSFPYRTNTGYIMINGPTQWHGMLNHIPSQHWRMSSYTYFMNFDHK